jgi:hypothetical protein
VLVVLVLAIAALIKYLRSGPQMRRTGKVGAALFRPIEAAKQ